MKPITGPELCRLLEEKGWKLQRISGSHHIYTKPGERKVLSISVPANRQPRSPVQPATWVTVQTRTDSVWCPVCPPTSRAVTDRQTLGDYTGPSRSRPLRFRVFVVESPLESFRDNVARRADNATELLISRSMMKLEFEWDDAKAEANWRNHGVSFELAKTVFNDPFAIERVDDREDYGEERFVIIGMAEGHVLLFVAYTERDQRIRLISARRVTQYEQEDYFRQNA